MNTKWREKSTADKAMLVLRIIVSVVVLVCALLKLFGVWSEALNVAIPLLGVLILIQSIQEHKERELVSAIVGYVCFAVLVVIIFSVWFVK